MALKVLAWLSDHEVTDEQRKDLEEQGYEIVWVKSPQPERWSSSTVAVAAVIRKCNGIPDAVMMILPEVMGGGFMLDLNRHAEQHHKKVIYIQAEMIYNGRESRWTGHWVRLKGVEYVRERVPSRHRAKRRT